MPASRHIVVRGHTQPRFLPTPQNTRLRRLHRELQTHNNNEQMVTYDVATESWVPYARPHRALHSGVTAVAASGFKHLSPADGYTPPICPHASDTTKGESHYTMDLHLRKKHQGRSCDYFLATSHPCSFVVIIPPLHPPVVLYTQEQIDEHSASLDSEEAAELRELYSYDKDFLQDFSESSPSHVSTSDAEEVELMLAPVAGSSRTASVPRSSSGGGALVRRLFPEAPSRNYPTDYGYNPRVLPSLTFGDSPSPPPRRVLSGSRARAAAFFIESVAEARAMSDEGLIANLYYNANNGVYKDDPTCHPAWEAIHTPLVLQPYDEKMFPNCTNRIYQNMDYMTTALGQALRQANSILGVPKATLNTITELSTKCDACRCVFTKEGFNQHIKEGKCGNSHFETQIVARNTAIDITELLKLRTFASTPPSNPKEFLLDTPLGIAFLEFNSRIGVPMDVWVVISTAFVECSVCNLCRTFPGHRAHLDDAGGCQDAGEDGSSFVKGKGKEKAAVFGGGKQHEGDGPADDAANGDGQTI